MRTISAALTQTQHTDEELPLVVFLARPARSGGPSRASQAGRAGAHTRLSEGAREWSVHVLMRGEGGDEKTYILARSAPNAALGLPFGDGRAPHAARPSALAAACVQCPRHQGDVAGTAPGRTERERRGGCGGCG